MLEKGPLKYSSNFLDIFGNWCFKDGWLPCSKDYIWLVKYALSRKSFCKHDLAGRNPSPDMAFESLKSGVNDSYSHKQSRSKNTWVIKSVVFIALTLWIILPSNMLY